MNALRLDERIPEKGFKTPDEALYAFLAWVDDQKLTLYPHQEQAILSLFLGNHVVLDAPTGSGKSLVATAMHFKSFAELGRAWYTAPIKALVSEKFFALCKIFGAEHVGMMTGDGAINRTAPILCCTAEILANLALREGEDAKVHSVVMDEFHYYGDRDRGMAWQIPLLRLPKTAFLLMSATLGDTTRIREDLERRTGRTVEEVRGSHRPVPLEYQYCMTPTHETIPELIRTGKAPVYVVHFAQHDATEQAQALTSVEVCQKEEKKAIQEAIRGFRFHSPFGPTVKKYLNHGIGLHHAGLLPRYRLLTEQLAQKGLLKAICGTDTLGVGINVPIRTVLFTQLCKFDGEKVDILKVRDFKQIAGRAGRAGFDSIGYVHCQAPPHIIENARTEAKITDPKKLRKVVKAQPPTRGYKHWDQQTFQNLIDRPPEPLESRFQVDHGRLLSLMQHAQETHDDAHRGYEAMYELIEQSHAPPAQREKLHRDTEALLQSLIRAAVVAKDGYKLTLDPNLQQDFSMHHTLSLLLIEAIAVLDMKEPDYALHLLSWIEAILESPRAVLLKQVDREKRAKLMELKAAGVPYEDRLTALEDVTFPKPHAEEIYALYEAWRNHHPWMSVDAVQPKTIAREIVERQCSFADYIQELEMMRAEGVLLRYLTDVYKALLQNVPADRRTPAVTEMIGFLRAMLGMVDSSLLTEWEQLLSGKDLKEEPRKLDISADRPAFLARIRAEMQAIIRAMARSDWEEAAACTRRAEDGPWGPQEIEAAMRPFFEEFSELSFDHRARMAEHFRIQADGPHRWIVRQRLFPPAHREQQPDLAGFEPEESGSGWAISGRVDLRGDTNPEGPLVEVTEIGE